ncbi:hypothetical protein BJY00DRAFT_310570 [Aspergillus carlsbadensis]|nr:hypothetical protein BJY00DRAFT_310570 [Aspergillus carlsbadensis]
MEGSSTQATLSDRARLCQISFDQCLAGVVCVSPQSRAAIEDQLGRFSIWASNTGVFAAARASLDYRLREAEEVQRLVMGLLRTLDESIQKCISGPPGPSDSEGCQSPVLLPGPSFDCAVGEIAEQISLLHEISNMIRRASGKKHNATAATSFVLRDEQGDDYGPRFRNLFALAMIRHTFPQCSQAIQERLADAMLLRRKRILYRHSRYAQSPLKGATSETHIAQRSRTTSQLEARRDLVTDSAIGAQNHPTASSPARSVAKSQAITATTFDKGHWKEVSAAPSVGSQATTIQLPHDHTFSFPPAPRKPLLQRLEEMKTRHLANLDEELESLPNYDLYQRHSYHPPLQPKALEELRGSIEELTAKTSMIIDNDRIACEAGSMDVTCPYCCCIISSATAMDRNKWAVHVKHDIDPYPFMAQTHAPAPKPLSVFSQISRTASVRKPVELRLLVERQSQSSSPLFESCPLCKFPQPTDRLESHIASHLVHLALKSLPAFGEDEDSEDSGDALSYSNTTDPQTENSVLDDDGHNQRLADHGVADGSDAANQLLAPNAATPMLILTALPTPTLSGFTSQISQLNPRLARALVERFAIEQVRRYKRLANAQYTHADVAAQGTCRSESFCLAQGGRPMLLPPSTKDPKAFLIYGAESDDTDITDPVEPTVTIEAAQFLPGRPLPPKVRRLPARLECQLCFQVKSFHTPANWSKHIIEDLQPYSCTFLECQDPKSFKRKADWVRHENERHRKLEWWECDRLDCKHKCYRQDNYIQHLVREHRMPAPKMKSSNRGAPKDASRERERAELWETVERNRRETTKMPSEEPCRFCGEIYTTWKELTMHMAKHFERIALPVLRLVKPPSVTSGDGPAQG